MSRACWASAVNLSDCCCARGATAEGLAGLHFEERPGDLLDRASLDRALSGCRALYHVAADYRLWARNPDEIRRSNVEGTRNILEAALAAGLERVVYTSTVGTIGMPGDEETPLGPVRGVYKTSKLEAERIALEISGQGLPVVSREPHGAGRRARSQADPDRAHHRRLPPRRDAGLRRHRAQPGRR